LPFIKRAAIMLSASITLSQDLRFHGLPAFNSGTRASADCLFYAPLAPMAKRWYIIHAYSNFENKVADSILEQAKHRHLDHLFEEIIVPTEKLVDVRHGQKHATERKFFPGYVRAKMELTDEVPRQRLQMTLGESQNGSRSLPGTCLFWKELSTAN
jgi:Transcription termination factor nusG